MIAKKIKKMKDNKSPGVDGIPPKLLKEIIEQISTPLTKVFNSLYNGKKQTLRRYLTSGRGISHNITDQ